MEIDIKLNAKEDFMMLCTIFEIKPEQLLQSFIDQMSFPKYYSNQNRRDKWAVLFFLEQLDAEEYTREINEEIQSFFLLIFSTAIQQSLTRYPDDHVRAEDEGRKIMKDWQIAVLLERAKYLTDGL